jgi:hypothetical protein
MGSKENEPTEMGWQFQKAEREREAAKVASEEEKSDRCRCGRMKKESAPGCTWHEARAEKARKKRQEIPHTFTPTPEHLHVDSEEPAKLDAVLDNAVGAATVQSPNVRDLAYEVIDKFNAEMSLKQWHVVQAMIEHAITVGYSAGLNDATH